MSDWIEIEKLPPEKIKKEKEKAKQLRKTNWWQAELAKGICHFCRKNSNLKNLQWIICSLYLEVAEVLRVILFHAAKSVITKRNILHRWR